MVSRGLGGLHVVGPALDDAIEQCREVLRQLNSEK